MANPAHAIYDPIGSGQTKLALDKDFISFLKENAIAFTAKAGAKRKGKAITLPVISGNVDPTLGKGEIDNGGAISFQSAKGTVPLRKVTVNAKKDVFTAKVGGSQLKVATSTKLSTKRSGFGTYLTAKQLKLTAKVATRLNKKLRPKVEFEEGQLLGILTSDAQPRLVTILPQGRVTLVFDAAFVAKLDAHFVSLNPIFPAEHVGPTFTFPVIGGSQLAPGGSEGTLRTGGQVEMLQLGAGQVFWNELWLDMAAKVDSAEVDIEPTPAFPGKLGRIGVLDLGATSLAANPGARTISTSNAPLTLQAQAAAQLNDAFAEGKADFVAGEVVGALSFTAQGQ
ncbi:MAG TPA: hypothetical protein VFW48_09720 [Solirubrobacterales bacterium]|nr:hypothetical protein [Solirubrobacterales bacterium]